MRNGEIEYTVGITLIGRRKKEVITKDQMLNVGKEKKRYL